MKKLIITVVFTLATALTGMTTWAAAITVKKDFSSGNTLSSTEMNTNFSMIENVVNNTNTLTTTLPDGVNTYLSFSLTPPADYTPGGGATVIAFWSGCEGTDVRLAHFTNGYSIGANGNFITFPALSTLSVAVAGGGNYTIFQSVYQAVSGFGTSSYTTFSLGRAGGDALDTCNGDLKLRGVEFRYATSGVSGRLSIPVTSLAR